MAAPVRLGTCSFADEALTGSWYPASLRSGPERLRFYARWFSTVEIDSSFYRLPDPASVARWADATPEGFVFHVKAFAALTRHPVRPERLPPDLRPAGDGDAALRRLPDELLEELARRFVAALEPLRRAGKLGGVLVQLPPYVVARPSSLRHLDRLRELLPGERLLVEFRHRSWLDEEHVRETLRFLEDRKLTLVAVDAPRLESSGVIPTLVALTTGTAYVRLHGRNARTWFKRGGSAADRFDYLYRAEELEEWVEPLRGLAEEADEAYVLVNTNNRAPASALTPELRRSGIPTRARDGEEWVAQGPANALLLRRLLDEAGVPTG